MSKIDRFEYYRGKKGQKYGIYNAKAKRFQFSICEDTPMLAEARLFQMIGDDAHKWRFEPRALPPDGKTMQNVTIDDAIRYLKVQEAAGVPGASENLKYFADTAPEAFARVIRTTTGDDYTPICPRGYTDCVWDPAYIKCKHPEWYARLYGDKTPEEAARAEGGCFDKVKKDPGEKHYCYDDEDK